MRRFLAALCALTLAIGPAGAQYRPGQAPGFRPGFQFIGGAGGFPAPGAVVDYDFANNRYSGPAITVSNASGGYVDDSAGNWTLVPPNTLRRSDKGVLIEGAQTNSIRNNSMQGAVPLQSQNAIRNNSMQGAVAGSPGTVPTNWSGYNSGTGLSASVVGVSTINGLDYIDYQISGTTTAAINVGALMVMEQGGIATAANGQTWNFSAYLQLLSGSLSGVTIGLDVSERGTGNSFLVNHITPAAIDGTLSRYQSSSPFTNASTVSVQPVLRLSIGSGIAVNFTLRIASPQLEQSVTAGPVTRTTGTAAAFSPGVLPTNWGGPLGTGISRQVVGTGTENGIDYVDLRFSGTATSTYGQIIRFESTTGVAVAQNQLWSLSLFAKLVGGSATGIGTFNTGFIELGSGGATVAGANSAVTAPTSAPLGTQRLNASRTLTSANAVSLDAYYWFNITSGTAIDITIRIGWPQLEQWNTAITTVGGASSPIRTTGTAATRAADVVTAPITGLLTNAVTVAGVYRSTAFHALNGWYAGLTDGTLSNQFVYRNSGFILGSVGFSLVINGGAITGGNPANFNNAAGDSARHSFAFSTQSPGSAFSVDGQVPNTANSTYTFPSFTTLNIGGAPVSAQGFSYIERLAVFPYRAANSNLQTFSTLSNWGG